MSSGTEKQSVGKQGDYTTLSYRRADNGVVYLAIDVPENSATGEDTDHRDESDGDW